MSWFLGHISDTFPWPMSEMDDPFRSFGSARRAYYRQINTVVSLRNDALKRLSDLLAIGSLPQAHAAHQNLE